MEVWKEVKDYEGLYQVSNFGRVKSLKRKGVLKDKILKPTLESIGYSKVALRKNSKGKNKRIHQLVVEAFLNHTTCGHKLVVDHINNIKTDNRLENLQLITARENLSKDREGGSSKYIGVSWNKKQSKWKASIRIKENHKYLGMFTDELRAAEAYQTALKEIR